MQSYNSIIHIRWKNMISVVLHVLSTVYSVESGWGLKINKKQVEMFELNGQSELLLLNNHQTPPAEKKQKIFQWKLVAFTVIKST
jgi:hypothetical protein